MKKELDFIAFWAINDKPNIETARKQLTEMKRLGLTGVIFHPRNYPGDPEYLGTGYMALLSEIILSAKDLGLSFWLYDENGFPSGTASGKVLERNPQSRCEWLEYQDGKVVIQSKNAVSTLDKKACLDFVDITFEGYRRGLTPEAFDYVTGVFSDEVGFLDGRSVSIQYGGVPWCSDLPSRYEQLYGTTLTDKLHLLFVNEPGYEQVRENYWYLLTSILRENFYDPISDWCQKNQKLYTAHLKGEENIFFNISYNGSPYQILKNIAIPAIDALERYPSNHYYPHIASSLARQFSNGKCLCEAMGGSGWGTSPQEFIDYMCWLVECGINMFTFHLSQYVLKAEAIRDWPPSLPFDVSWKEAFPTVLRQIQEYKNQLDRKQETLERVLIVAPTCGCIRKFLPTEAACINEHNGAGVPDTAAGTISNRFNDLVETCYEQGILYDVTEECLLEQYGSIQSDGLQLGNMYYSKVLLGKNCHFHDKTLVDRLEACGLLLKAPVRSNTDIVAPTMPPIETLSVDTVPWRITACGTNQMLLELREGTGIRRTTDVTIAGLGSTTDMMLKCSDPIEQLLINKIPVYPIASDNTQQYYVIPRMEIYNGHLEIEVLPLKNGEPNPFLFLQGDFLVLAQDKFIENKKGQLETNGDFLITFDTGRLSADSLISTGRPFSNTPVTLAKTLYIPKDTQSIRLSEVHACAIRITFENQQPTWIFDVIGAIPVPPACCDMECLVEIELYPSTYNALGPHHHIDGDRHLTSPAQYSGKKNFADFPDSPENTLVNKFHFVKLGIGNNVSFLKYIQKL